MMAELVIGSRGSELALWQARWVVSRIIETNPGMSCRIEIITTTGDRQTDAPLAKIGDKGLFVKEIELALLNGQIDVAVHSAKDLPSEMDGSLYIAAFPKREDPRDALVSKAGKLNELPKEAVIGTSSVRRRAQIMAVRPDVKIVDLRGNLDTRLRKLCGSEYDAIILACAGLRRMSLECRITEALPIEVSLPAAGQGALAVQCRRGDPAADIVSNLDDALTRRCVSAERAVLAALGAGCQTPVGAHAREIDGRLVLDALVAGLDGSRIVRKSISGELDEWNDLGIRLAGSLLESGARDLLEDARRSEASGNIGAA
ncbi:MAG: hydroxymethylbilane synthase [Armatimonadota bacterium]|nr:hydroxymethylbilane synthase [bacterium]